MILKMAVTGLLFALVGCRHLSGTIAVFETTAILDVDGRVRDLMPGEYQVRGESKEQATYVELAIEVVGEMRPIKFTLPIPANYPTQEHFYIKANDSGQGFDLEGDAKSSITDGAIVNDFERCKYRAGPRSRTGRRRVEYFERVLHFEVWAAFINPKSLLTSAKLMASREDNQRIYRYRGECRPGNY